MQIIEELKRFVNLPSQQIEIKADVPDNLECKIFFGTNDDPDAPYLAVQLLFVKEGYGAYHIVFPEEPPYAPFKEFAVSGKGLLEFANADRGNSLDDLLAIFASQAYTPLAKVYIHQKDHWLDIWLVIGEWEGHHQVTLDEFMQ